MNEDFQLGDDESTTEGHNYGERHTLAKHLDSVDGNITRPRERSFLTRHNAAVSH